MMNPCHWRWDSLTLYKAMQAESVWTHCSLMKASVHWTAVR